MSIFQDSLVPDLLGGRNNTTGVAAPMSQMDFPNKSYPKYNPSYETLRRDMISILGQHVKIPNEGGVGSATNDGQIPHNNNNGGGKDHFDSYISKLQNICSGDDATHQSKSYGSSVMPSIQ